MIKDVCIINGAWIALTDWFPPENKPVRTGNYLVQFFDAGWMYDWMVYWDNDRRIWLDKPDGNSLINQQQTWRGQQEQQ